jgi:hypothetical protein
MLKAIGKFEDSFIVNLNIFIAALLNDSKSHVNLFIVLMVRYRYRRQFLNQEKCNPSETT